jgi:hypothetical protein
MTTKPPLHKVYKGISQTDEESYKHRAQERINFIRGQGKKGAVKY